MKWQCIWPTAGLWLLALGLAGAAPVTALEPLVAALEPISLRTALARPLPGALRTVVVPAREDAVLGLTHLSREEFAATGLDWDQFMARAAAAATRLLVTLKPVVERDASGQIAYIKLRGERPFTASVVLSPRLLPLFQGVLGDRLVALMPDRQTVYLFSRNFGAFQAFGQKIIDEHADTVYPCSIEAFEISPDGLKCIGGFDDGAAPLAEATAVPPAGAQAPPRAELPRPKPPASRPAKPKLDPR